MAVTPIGAAQQAPATTMTPEEEAQFAAEFESMIALTVGPLMATSIMRQAGFAKQVLNEALSDK